jgi:catechol 2,3-dioxygenase-like lactoylglutathione lyase family enzyme
MKGAGRSAALFIAGVGVGAVLTQSGIAQDSRPRALSHVGIAVKDFDRTIAYYTQTLGFREAYSLKQADGSPLLTYLHVNRDTFLEVQPATPALPPGLTHFAVEYGDLKAAVARMRQSGATLADPAQTPGKALFSRLRDLDGVSIEVMEFGPESQQRRAMNAWKD